MTAKLKVICRSLERRINVGEQLETILAASSLSDAEKQEITTYFSEV